MTATNIFFNFVGFRYSPALRCLNNQYSSWVDLVLNHMHSVTATPADIGLKVNPILLFVLK